MPATMETARSVVGQVAEALVEGARHVRNR